MKNKIVVWGTNAQEERVLIGMELQPKENKVSLHIFPEKILTDEFVDLMYQEWRNEKDVAFPEGHTTMERELMASEGLLPDEIKVERGDIIQRAQAEWHFVVLSTKLSEVYRTELEELKQKVQALTDFDSEIWNNLKSFWNKVQGQVRERNLFKKHADTLRDGTNALFEEMKQMRGKMDEKFKKESEEHLQSFNEAISKIEERIGKNGRMQALFEELKTLQRKWRDKPFTHAHRRQMRDRLDAAFKAVKEKRFGPGANSGSRLQRMERRYDGLSAAIHKMEQSIQRDRDDLEFQDKKIATTDGQLEAQIRQAKVVMIEERIRSKEEKLNEMRSTMQELNSKIGEEKVREEQRAQKAATEKARKAAKEEAKEKIAEQIKEAEEARKDDEQKLEETAAKILSSTDAENEKTAEETQNTANEDNASAEKNTADKKEEGLLDAIGTTMGEALEDVVTTAKAVAEVVGEKIEGATARIIGDDDKKEEEKVAASPENGDTKQEESLLDAVGDTMGEALSNAITTAKAVADVVGEKIEEATANILGNDDKKEEDKVDVSSESGDTKKEESTLEAVGDVVGEALDNAITTAKTVASAIVEKLEDAGEKVAETVNDIVEGEEE